MEYWLHFLCDMVCISRFIMAARQLLDDGHCNMLLVFGSFFRRLISEVSWLIDRHQTLLHVRWWL